MVCLFFILLSQSVSLNSISPLFWNQLLCFKYFLCLLISLLSCWDCFKLVLVNFFFQKWWQTRSHLLYFWAGLWQQLLRDFGFTFTGIYLVHLMPKKTMTENKKSKLRAVPRSSSHRETVVVKFLAGRRTPGPHSCWLCGPVRSQLHVGKRLFTSLLC